MNRYENPAEPTNPLIRQYFSMSLGFQLQIIILHFKKTRNHNFYEMLLHHVMTVSLLCNAYLID